MIVVRRNYLEEGDRAVVGKALVIVDGYGGAEVATPRKSSRSSFGGARKRRQSCELSSRCAHEFL